MYFLTLYRRCASIYANVNIKTIFQACLLCARNLWVKVTQFGIENTTWFLKRQALLFEHLYQHNYFWFWVAQECRTIYENQSFPSLISILLNIAVIQFLENI